MLDPRDKMFLDLPTKGDDAGEPISMPLHRVSPLTTSPILCQLDLAGNR